MIQKGTNETLRVRGQTYRVLERLSLPRRGRWKVHHRDPAPHGTILTAIILPTSAESQQLRKSVVRLPSHHSGLPRLVAWESTSSETTMLVSWCEGIDLADYYRRFRRGGTTPISVWEAIRRGKSLAHSLSGLHTYAGVIHADIKPPNLILPSEQGSIALVDFGSAWQLERTATRAVGDGANPSYASPELFLEQYKIDARSDQFSAAVVIFEMLTGKLPYEGYGGKAGHPGFEAVAKAYQPPSRLTKWNSIPRTISSQIDQVLSVALQLQPERRFSNTREFARALGGIWSDLQAKANRPPLPNATQPSMTLSDTVLRWLIGGG